MINLVDVQSLLTPADGVAWLGTSYSLDDLEKHSRALYATVTEVLGHSGACDEAANRDRASRKPYSNATARWRRRLC